MSVTWKCPSPIGRNVNPCTRFWPLAFKKSTGSIENLKMAKVHHRGIHCESFLDLSLFGQQLVSLGSSRSQHCSPSSRDAVSTTLDEQVT